MSFVLLTVRVGPSMVPPTTVPASASYSTNGMIAPRPLGNVGCPVGSVGPIVLLPPVPPEPPAPPAPELPPFPAPPEVPDPDDVADELDVPVVVAAVLIPIALELDEPPAPPLAPVDDVPL